MSCVLLSKLNEGILREAFEHLARKNYKRAIIVPFADDEEAIVHIYKKIYDKTKIEFQITQAEHVLKSICGFDIKVNVLAENNRNLIYKADIVIILGGHPTSCMDRINCFSLNNAFLRKNVLYIGISAGAKVLCEDFLSYDYNRNVVAYKGLGVAKGLRLFVHYNEKNQLFLSEHQNDVQVIGISDGGYVCINEKKCMILKNVKIL